MKPKIRKSRLKSNLLRNALARLIKRKWYFHKQDKGTLTHRNKVFLYSLAHSYNEIQYDTTILPHHSTTTHNT